MNTDDKLDKIEKHLSSIDRTLAVQAKSLDEHIRRTTIAEENIETVRSDLRKVETFKERLIGAGKLLGSSVVLVSLFKALSYLSTVLPK